MTTITQARAPVSPEVRLTAPQVITYHALRRQVATLAGDAELLTQLGEGIVADEMRACAAALDMLSGRYIAEAQRTVVLASVVPS